MPSRAIITPLSVNRFPNKLVPKVANNILRNLTVFSFPSFLIVFLTPFIHKPDSSNNLIIFKISIISSFGLISIVYFADSKERALNPKIFF